MAITVSEERLKWVIQYGKLEEQAEDPGEKLIIEGLCLGSMVYLANSEVVETEKNSPLYWIIVGAMTLHAYDHRDQVGFVPAGVRDILNQLKLKANYPEGENSDE